MDVKANKPELSVVGERSVNELVTLLESGCTFSFRAVDSDGDVLTYEVCGYSDDKEAALFISLERDIIYCATYDNLAGLIDTEPVNLGKFVIQYN